MTNSTTIWGIDHCHLIVVALHASIHFIAEIDDCGGWPGAFQPELQSEVTDL